MARTEQEIASDINAKNEVKILEALKDYFAKKYNTNFDNIKLNLDAIKNALNGLSGIKEHLGVPHVPSSTAPTNPNEYDWYFDISTNKFMMYHNSAWVVIADLANLINLDAKYLKISDAQRDYAQTNNVNAALDGKADKSTTYTKAEIDSTLGGRAHVINVLTDNEKSVLAGVQFTSDEKSKLSKVVTTDTQQDISGKADITYVDGELAKKQAIIIGKPATVLAANPFTDEEKAKVDTAVQPAAISDVLRTGDVYTNAEIDSKVAGAAGQFVKGTIAELNDRVNGAQVDDSDKKVLVIDDLKKMVENQNLINKGSFVNFVDKVIYKDSTTLEYFDTVLNIEVKDAAATTKDEVMTLTHPLDVYGRISVEGTSFGALFEIPCAVEYNFLTKNKGVKFYGTKGQTYKWELISKYENDVRVNYVRFEGTSTMSTTDNPGDSATWTTVTMPHEVKMDTLFDKDNKNAQINIDFNPSLPTNGAHILDLEYYTTIPYLEARIANIIAQLQKDIGSVAPNFTTEEQAVLAGEAFTRAYKLKLDNAPDNINTKLGEKLDVSTYNTDKSTFLTSASIAGKADTTYVDGQLAGKQNTLTTANKDAIVLEAIKAWVNQANSDGGYAGLETSDPTKVKSGVAKLIKLQDILLRVPNNTNAELAKKANITYVDTELAKKQNILTDPEKLAISKLSFTDALKTKYDGYTTSIAAKADATATTTAIGAKADKTAVDGALALKQDKLSTEQLALLGTGAIKYTQTADDRITANHSDIVLLKGKGAFLGKFADATARDAALAGKTLVNGDYVILGDPAVRWVYDLRTTSWIEDISHSAAISSITLQDVASAQDPKIATAKNEAITAANTHSDGAIATLTTTVNGKQDAIDAGKLALLDGAVKFTQADKTKVDGAIQAHQDISGKADTSWVTTQLAAKQNNLSNDQKSVIDANPFTDAYKTKLDDAITASTQQDISGKANITYVDTELAKKADKSYVDTQLGGKVNTSTYNTKMGQLDTAISGKADTTALDGKANTSLNNVRINGHGNKLMYVNDQGYVTYIDKPAIPDVSNFETTTNVNRKIGEKFTEQSDKLTSNNTDTLPGTAKIGHGYKGVQSYGEGASEQHYGKGAIDTINIGEGAQGRINIGKNLTGTLVIGTSLTTVPANHQMLAHGNKIAMFEDIIDIANANPFTDYYKNKIDTALQPSAINSKVDASTMNTELAKKANTSLDNVNVGSTHARKLLFTDGNGKLTYVDYPTIPDISGKADTTYVNSELAKKQNVVSNLENRLIHNDSNATTAIIRKNSSYNSQSYIDNAAGYVGVFSGDATKYATVKLQGTTPKLFGHDGATQYDIPFSNIQTKLNTSQMNVVNATPFTQAEKTKLANTASSTDAAAKANKDLSNIVTDQEKADFISNLTRIGVQVALFNEFKGVLPSDPTGSHNDLDWYINDTTYVIKVWHNNSWHDIGRPDHVLTKAEVITALGLTQTDIDNLKYLTNVRSSFSTIISKANEISHLPANTITALSSKADTTTVNSQIATKLNSSVFNTEKAKLNSAISSKADASALAGKADVGASYTKSESDGKYATKTALAGKQDAIHATQLLDSHSSNSTAVFRQIGNYKSNSYVGSSLADLCVYNGTNYGSIRIGSDGIPRLYGQSGTTKVNIPLADVHTKLNALTTAGISNANHDHSVYALKTELPTSVDIDNSVDYINGNIFSGQSFGHEYIVSNGLKIYGDFWMGSTDNTLNNNPNDRRGIKITVNNSLRGWQTLVRIDPGLQGNTMAFDLQGFYDNDGGITKLRASVGGAGGQSGWLYVRERWTIRAIATPSKKWADVIETNFLYAMNHVESKLSTRIGNNVTAIAKNTIKLLSIEPMDTDLTIIFNSGREHTFKVAE